MNISSIYQASLATVNYKQHKEQIEQWAYWTQHSKQAVAAIGK